MTPNKLDERTLPAMPDEAPTTAFCTWRDSKWWKNDGAIATVALLGWNAALDWQASAIAAREPLMAEIERLRALVESAYREGFDDASYHESARLPVNESWGDSSSRAALKGDQS